jgi:AAA+ ATPase superfamily predicted ATPase
MADWGFYGRQAERAAIDRILGRGRWFFCAVSGRRRIGKTTLLQRALENAGIAGRCYFQVPDSDEAGVLRSFQDALEDCGRPQHVASFRDMAKAIRSMCEEGWIVVMDEFQHFHRAALAPFASFLQQEVDVLRDTRRGGLFVLGSIHTEMMAILEDRNSPLFQRATDRIEVDHWDGQTLFEMFDAHEVASPHQRLFFWSLFEGVPKFYRDAFDQGVLVPSANYRREVLRRLFFEGSSPLREEAANWFLRELRGRYDSVLKLLARLGPCSHGQLIAEYTRSGGGTDKQLGGYLAILIDRFRMIERLLPVFASDRARKSRYAIADNFLSAWLAAIGRNVDAVRVQPVDACVQRAAASLETHEGFAFEKMVKALTEECSRKRVGDFPLSAIVRGYWNKPDGSDIEVDVVAYDENRRVVRFGSCKRAADGHEYASFDGHIARFLRTAEGRRFAGWTIEKALYSPRFDGAARARHEANGYRCIDLSNFAEWLRSVAVRQEVSA